MIYSGPKIKIPDPKYCDHKGPRRNLLNFTNFACSKNKNLFLPAQAPETESPLFLQKTQGEEIMACSLRFI